MQTKHTVKTIAAATAITNVGLAAGIGILAATGLLVTAPVVKAPLGTSETSVASASVRLLDHTTDLPASPSVPDEVCRFNTVRVPCPPPPASPPQLVLPPGTVLPPGVEVLPDGVPLPPLPPGVVLPPEVPQMLDQGLAMLASPPPNVPDEVCRFNTVRVPCP